MDKFEHFIYYTKTPEGPDYLSITVLGRHGLVERKVFPVVGEPLDQTPHIDGMQTKRLFIIKTSPNQSQ